MMKLFNNPPKAIIAIVAVLALFFAYKGCEATELELGPTFTGEFNGGYGLVLTERFLDNKLDFGVALIGEQEWEDVRVENNGNVFVSFVATKPEHWWNVLPTEVHAGATHWIKAQAPINGCKQGYLLGLKWRINDWSIGVRHWSNAGTCKPNRGQDLLTFGYRF